MAGLQQKFEKMRETSLFFFLNEKKKQAPLDFLLTVLEASLFFLFFGSILS